MMLKQFLSLLLLSVSLLSAETTVAGKEPVKKPFSYRQKIIIGGAIIASDALMTLFLVKTTLDCLLSKNICVGTKAARFTTALAASVALSIMENKFFEKHPNFFGTCKVETPKQGIFDVKKL